MELVRALAVLAEAPHISHQAVAEALGLPEPPDEAAYTELFVLQLWPYASVYLGFDGMAGGEPRSRIAGFFEALQLSVPDEPDHLALLLGLYATLNDREASECDPARRLLVAGARQALLWEHLLPWVPPYLHKLQEMAPPFYRRWGALLFDVLRSEAARGELPPRPPAHLRAVPAVPDPRAEGVDLFLAGLLAPARSGLVLTQADLTRAARGLSAAVRLAERRLALRCLLEQDPSATLGWLRAEALRWRAWHLEEQAWLGCCAESWGKRAAATAGLLSELCATVATQKEA